MVTPLGKHPPGQTPPGQTPPWWANTLPLPSACWDTHSLPSAYWDTVNKRAVRIPLECILVYFLIAKVYFGAMEGNAILLTNLVINRLLTCLFLEETLTEGDSTGCSSDCWCETSTNGWPLFNKTKIQYRKMLD